MCFCPEGASGIRNRTLANKSLSFPICPVMLPGSGCTKDYEYLLIIIDIIFEAEKMFIPLYPFYLHVFRDNKFLKITNERRLSGKWEQCCKSLEAKSPETKYFMSMWNL